MSGIATKAVNSVFYKARMAAKEHNEMLSSREGAAEVTGIDRTRIARIELNTLVPYPEDVVIMADVYNAPQLMNYFCTHECPIGKRIAQQADLEELNRMTINILNALNGVSSVSQTVLAVVDDGQVTDEEMPEMERVLMLLQQVGKAATETDLDR